MPLTGGLRRSPTGHRAPPKNRDGYPQPPFQYNSPDAKSQGQRYRPASTDTLNRLPVSKDTIDRQRLKRPETGRIEGPTPDGRPVKTPKPTEIRSKPYNRPNEHPQQIRMKARPQSDEGEHRPAHRSRPPSPIDGRPAASIRDQPATAGPRHAAEPADELHAITAQLARAAELAPLEEDHPQTPPQSDEDDTPRTAAPAPSEDPRNPVADTAQNRRKRRRNRPPDTAKSFISPP